jgi:hypothetical protein
MTQFLLVQTAGSPIASGSAAKRVTENPYLVRSARHNFGEIDDVWVVRPTQGELDVLVGDAHERLQGSGTYPETELAKLLTILTDTSPGIVLFWASYPNDLPNAASPSELHAMVESQLREATSGPPELYVRWQRA